MADINSINPRLDLVLERVVDVPRELLWRGWTEPELMKQWFTPAPWKTVDAQVDLRPGGIFHAVMSSPEGQVLENAPGCILEVVENEKLVWTSVLGPGFRPLTVPAGFPSFTAIIKLEEQDGGTKYTAIARHGDEQACKQHADLGFHPGWSAALDQLVALAKTL